MTSAPAGREALYIEAIRMINEFYRHRSGITYPMQGYHCGDGVTVPIRKLEEHDLVSHFANEAQAERNELDSKKR